ncbi:acyltransferase domain-containing protein, partial [Cystoisospora suis]
MAPVPIRILLTVYFYCVVSIFFCLAFLTELIAYVLLSPFSFRHKGVKARVLSSIFQTYMLAALYCLPFWRVKFLNSPPLASSSSSSSFSPSAYNPKRTVIMANHASGADPWLLTAVVYPWPAFFVIKDSLCRVPIAGWCLALAGSIRVKFTKEKGGWATAPGAVKLLMQESNEVMDRGHALVVFPEGTRSVTGRLQPFKDGFFRFAVEHEGISILPV